MTPRPQARKKAATKPPSTPQKPDVRQFEAAMGQVAAESPAIREELEGLILDTLTAMRTMVEVGDTTTRNAVFKIVAPYALKASTASMEETTASPADEARSVLLGAFTDYE